MEGIERAVREWLDVCPQKPVGKVDAEFLPTGGGLTVATAQAAKIQKRFILGGYEGQVQFAVVYRLAATDTEERLAADEALERMGAWAEARENWPSLGEGFRIRRVERTGAALKERHANGMEDHQMTVTVTYEGGIPPALCATPL